MTMKHTIAALCLVVGCIVALGFSTQPPAAVAVEPIEIVRPVPKAEFKYHCYCGNGCDCTDGGKLPCDCVMIDGGKSKRKEHRLTDSEASDYLTTTVTIPPPYVALKPTDTEWRPFAVYIDSDDKPAYCWTINSTTNCKRCYYKDTEWLWYGGKLWELKGGKYIEFHEPARAAATNSLVSRRTSTKGESGSCSSGGCSSGSCGVGRGGFFGRRR